MKDNGFKDPKNDKVTIYPADPKLYEEAMEEYERPLRNSYANLNRQMRNQERKAQIAELQRTIRYCESRIAELQAEIEND